MEPTKTSQASNQAPLRFGPGDEIEEATPYVRQLRLKLDAGEIPDEDEPSVGPSWRQRYLTDE